MTTLREGDVEFEFDEGCEASHYDKWAFFRNQFGRLAGGSKAVDFLCINDRYTWLIEVKNYRYHGRTKPSELHEEVATKVRDTLAGLAAARANAVDPERKTARRALSKRWRVALHLEQPNRPSKLRPKIIDPATLKMKLRQAAKRLGPLIAMLRSTPLAGHLGRPLATCSPAVSRNRDDAREAADTRGHQAPLHRSPLLLVSKEGQ